MDEIAINGQEGMLFDMTAVLNPHTSMLMMGSYIDAKCDIALNLRRNFGLAYFEDIFNLNNLILPQSHAKEVSVEIDISKFGSNDCFDAIATEFDWGVTTVPLDFSKFQLFVGDDGLLEQIRFAFLELHHQLLLCRKCDMEDLFKNIGLSFPDIHKFLSAETHSDMISALPVTTGTPTLDDTSIASYVAKIILMRGALLTSISVILANCYLEHENFDVPHSIIWAFNFMCEDYEEAENLFLKHPVSLKQVNSIICQKIRSTQNISLIKSYSEFLRKHCTDVNVRVKAYRCMLNLLVNTNMYKEASKLVQEFMETEIPLNNLQLSSLKLLHNYCLRNLDKDHDVLTFALPIKETYSSSSESDAEE
ncbi:hexokinase_2 domain-containing protein [Caerostris extrusa]|uniref:Hexokinase_2 domain-containing protein n=1 Tax=Caerostris extrusa TaxID=172846 RepID=A0AAV4RUH1_CAEEX|nr:hexokinase_2 domain-containing protein [Caerostris extrusa]